MQFYSLKGEYAGYMPSLIRIVGIQDALLFIVYFNKDLLIST